MEKNYKMHVNKIKCCMKAMLLCAIFSVTLLKAEEVQPQGFKTERLDNYLRKIELAYQVSFVYDASQINKAMPIEVPQKLISINSDLEPLKEKGINYNIVGKQVILKKAPVEQIVVRDLVVKGQVRSSADKIPLPGVSVREKGIANGVATNGNGEYQIKIKEGATLIFASIGYKTQEIAVNGRTTINISLEEDANQLKEVTISTGYQNLNKKLFTGAATKLKASDVERSGIQDVSRMLEGQVAGVSVQNVSGTFGAAPKIRVRGATSISGDNKPLWVVDGIVLEDIINVSNEQLSTGDPSTLIGSSVAGLNPDDIESMEILRDASATAMYGARAMNGVVVLTTKKGRNTEGKPVISYSGNFTTFLKPNYNQFDIMNSADQMQVYLDMENKGWLNHADVSQAANGGVFRKMYDLMYDYDPATDKFSLRNDAPSKLQFLNRYANANTNWFDVLFRNSLMQDHSVSIIAGSEKSKFYASTSFMNDSGWTVGDAVKRFTGTLRGNFDITDRLQIELLTQGNVRDQRSPGTVKRVDDDVRGQLDRDFDINPYKYALNTSRVLTAYDENGNLEYFTQNYAPFNIINELKNNSIQTTVIDFKVQGGLKYKILDGLRYSFDGSYRFAKTDREHSITEYSNAAEAYRAYGNQNIIKNNKYLYKDPANPGQLPQIVLPEGGFYNVASNNLVNYYMRHSLEYDKIFHEDHIFNVFASTELRYIDKQDRFNNGAGYQFDRGGVPFISYYYYKQASETNSPPYGMGREFERYLSYMTRVAYSYKGKYSINATGRYDGSNLLGESRTARWLPTWNISGAWNIQEENFYPKDNFFLNRATVRATYGLTASTANAKNSSVILLNKTTARQDDIDKEPIIYIDGLENSQLTWEKQYETNIGFDLGFLKDRITLSVDLYKRNAYDLIGLIPNSGIGGEPFKLANYADMKSKGIELTLNAKIINDGKFKWSTNLNFGYHKGEITSLENNPTIFSLITENGGARVGYPQRGLFSIVFDGLDPNTGVPTFINENGERKSKSVYFQDDDLSHIKYEGQIDPKLTGGYSNRFSYGNFALSALVTFSAGNKVRLSPNFANNYSDLSATSNDFLSRWNAPGDELITNVPSIADRFVIANLGSEAYPYNSYNYSTERVADGGFARLKQVMLTYQLPQQWAKRIGATNASVGVVGNNVWLIYSDSRLNGQDPEFFSAGGVAMPIPRQYSLSLKLGF